MKYQNSCQRLIVASE